MHRIVQDMQRSAPPPLLPLLRSRPQAEVLTLVTGDLSGAYQLAYDAP
jgi:hypothetical protein